MPELRSEILQSRLRGCRFGHTVKAYVPARTSEALRKLSRETSRTLRDICLMIFGVYAARKNFFELPISTGPKSVVMFRLSRFDARILRRLALCRGMRRNYMLGSVIHEFMKKVPKDYFAKILVEHADILARLEATNAGTCDHPTPGNDARQRDPHHRRVAHHYPERNLREPQRRHA